MPHLQRYFSLFLKMASAVIPAATCIFLVQHVFDARITDFFPAYDIDQYFYVREARTFAASQWNGGYYGSNGLTAIIGRFGPHGLAYPLVYGGLACWLGGWQDWLSPVLNMAFVTAALLVTAQRLSLPRQLALACLLPLFPPTLLYLPLGYQEAPQYALGLLLALRLAALTAEMEDGEPRKRLLPGTLALVFLASLTRPTWAALFPAVFFCATPGRLRDVPPALALGAGLLGIAYAAFSLTASPWDVQAGLSVVLSLLQGDPAPLLSRLVPNMNSLLNFTDNRHHTLTLLVMLGGTLLAMLPALAASPGQRRRLAALHVCNLLVPCLTYVTIYNGSGYQLTRLLSAHFLLSLGLAVQAAPPGAAKFVLAPVFAACLAMLPASLGQYALFVRPAYDDYQGFASRITALARDIGPALQLSANAPSPWLRTLGVMSDDIVEPALAAPSEYGIQVYSPQGLAQPLRPGFVLLGPKDWEIARKATPLTPVTATPHGVLYRNDAAFGLVGTPSATFSEAGAPAVGKETGYDGDR